MNKAAAIFLSLLFLSVNVEHWAYLYENHKHTSCESAKHHIHAEDFDCEHSNLYFSIRGYIAAVQSFSTITPGPQSTIPNGYQKPLISYYSSYKQLRAPPVLC